MKAYNENDNVSKEFSIGNMCPVIPVDKPIISKEPTDDTLCPDKTTMIDLPEDLELEPNDDNNIDNYAWIDNEFDALDLVGISNGDKTLESDEEDDDNVSETDEDKEFEDLSNFKESSNPIDDSDIFEKVDIKPVAYNIGFNMGKASAEKSINAKKEKAKKAAIKYAEKNNYPNISEYKGKNISIKNAVKEFKNPPEYIVKNQNKALTFDGFYKDNKLQFIGAWTITKFKWVIFMNTKEIDKTYAEFILSADAGLISRALNKTIKSINKELKREEKDNINESVYYDEYICESKPIDDDIKDVIDTLNEKGYTTKYSCSGHPGSIKKGDRNRNKVYYGKLYSTARIIFDKEYEFPFIPDGWTYKLLDGEKSAIYVKSPDFKLTKDGLPDSAVSKWKTKYMRALRNWVDELPKEGETTDDNDPTEKIDASLESVINDLYIDAMFD